MLTTPERRAITKLRRDPNLWIREVLGAGPWERQQAIVDAVWHNPRVAVASCHGIGKSYISARIALAFLYNHQPSIAITTAPTQRQVEKILWKEIRVAHARAAYPLGGKALTKELKLSDNWYAFGFSSSDHDPDRWQGFHEKDLLAVVDEAAGIARPVFDGIEGVLSSENAKLLLIGNPTDPTSAFADAFKKNSGFVTFHISAFDTPNFTTFGITQDDIADGSWEKKITGPLPAPYLVTPAWVADKHRRWGPTNPLYIAKVLGRFPEESEDALISMAWVQAAIDRDLKPGKPTALGLDIARKGRDSTACYRRQGDHVRRLFVSTKEDTMTTTGRAARALDSTKADKIHADVIGIGSGVCDRLAELGYPVSEINFGADAQGDRADEFANLKSQLYWNIRERFETGNIDISPDDEDVAAQAVIVRWKPNSKGKIMIESKDAMRTRGEESPDEFEAMVYAFADDVLEDGGEDWELV
jgi:hypothetical protein